MEEVECGAVGEEGDLIVELLMPFRLSHQLIDLDFLVKWVE